jgi:hypothetical protein
MIIIVIGIIASESERFHAHVGVRFHESPEHALRHLGHLCLFRGTESHVTSSVSLLLSSLGLNDTTINGPFKYELSSKSLRIFVKQLFSN